MTHRQPATFGSPVFRIRAPDCISGVGRNPPDLRPLPRPARSPASAAARQISGHREACPPARRPRCELRSARRLEARPGPAGLAVASNRATCHAVFHHLASHRRHMRYKTRPAHRNHHANGTKLAQHTGTIMQTVQNSPSTHKTPPNQPFFASRANIVTQIVRSPPSRASFVSLTSTMFTSPHSLAQLAAMQTTQRAHEPVMSHMGRDTHARMIGGACNPRDPRTFRG